MIIDIHVHHHLRPETPGNPASIKRLLDISASAGIDRLNLVGNLHAGPRRRGRYSQRLVRDINTVTMAHVEKHPDRLTGFCFLSPVHPRKFLESEIDRCIRRGNLVGIKLFREVNCSDDRLAPIMESAVEFGFPILQHAWIPLSRRDENESTAEDVARLAKRYPEAPIIMPHLGIIGYRGVLAVRDRRNVYVDNSGCQPVAGIIEYAVQILGAERVLFGSDASIRDFAVQRAKIVGALIPAAAKKKILGVNAARLLNLEVA